MNGQIQIPEAVFLLHLWLWDRERASGAARAACGGDGSDGRDARQLARE